MQDEASGVREAIEAAYAKLTAAVANKDLDAVRAVHATTFIERQTDGEEYDLSKVMVEWKELFASEEERSFRIVVESCARSSSAIDRLRFLRPGTTSFSRHRLRFNVRVQTISRDSWIETDERLAQKAVLRYARRRTWINGKFHRRAYLRAAAVGGCMGLGRYATAGCCRPCLSRPLLRAAASMTSPASTA